MKERERILVSVLIGVVAILLLGLAFSNKEEKNIQENEEEQEKEVVISYPKKVSGSESLEIDAAAAFSIYINGDDYKVLYEKNPQLVLPIASITKIMTAIIVVENYDIEQPVGVKEEKVLMQTEFRDFRAWEETRISEMLYPLLIESNNSAAFALASISNRFLDETKKPVEVFVRKMNEKGSEIGLKDTKFINPSGLDDNGRVNYSTAEDIARMAIYALSETDIFEILSMRDYRLYSPSGYAYYSFSNTNDFLFTAENGWEERIIGGKTGWTYKALGCLFLVLEVPEGEGYLVNVILGADDRFLEMKKMINFVYETYQF